MTTPFDDVLDAFEQAARSVPGFNGHAWVEREEKIDREEMPAALILPGEMVPVDLGGDTTAMNFIVKVLVFIGGERPSRRFYPLAADLHQELTWNVALQRLLAELPAPAMGEAEYDNHDGFTGIFQIRYALRLPVERSNISQPA
ncbi:hypothetical protein [Paraburkholderia pallida]|uniref:Uncharacterized protein n=1 Tax=Paraburkholderia pallida TaxID=2547399 RepID=A0A4V1AZ63_9BURK|nr:hypothetical protein [Paraburkholderia pallida]QBQ98172.1 hypothetical protein E1956_13970 [Paraburkholderia pallida]